MTTQQAVEPGTPITPAPQGHPTGRPGGTEVPAWLWESVRFRFWEPADLARGMRRAARGLEPQQRAVAARWWWLLAAANQLGPRLYAAAFLQATQQHDSDQLRWSLLAILHDQVQHEQLFGLALQSLAPGCPRPADPPAPSGLAERPLAEADQQAQRCWQGYRQTLDRHGLAAVTGGLLLEALVTGALYQHCALGCAIPALATALGHLGHDAQRHQDALRALAGGHWPRLSAPQRAATAAQVQAMAGFLTTVMLGPEGDLAALTIDDPVRNPAVACQHGLGVPSREQRLEILRAALLQVRDLQARHGLPVAAMPQLAIPARHPAASNHPQGGDQRAGR